MPARLALLPVVAAALALAGAARAADDSSAPKAANLDRAFGSTIVSTYPDGRQAELWLKKDGSYTAQGRRKDPSSGTWELKGERLCLHQKKPSLILPLSYCTTVPASLDKPWGGKAPTGEAISIALVKGLNGRSTTAERPSDGGGGKS
jgi:hypothetical protein